MIVLKAACSLDLASNCSLAGKTCRLCSKYIYLLSLATGRHLLGAAFTASLKSDFSTALATQASAEGNIINPHTQYTIALGLSIFLYEISGFRRGALLGCCAVQFAFLPTFLGHRILPIVKICSPETTLTIQINAAGQPGRVKVSKHF